MSGCSTQDFLGRGNPLYDTITIETYCWAAAQTHRPWSTRSELQGTSWGSSAVSAFPLWLDADSGESGVCVCVCVCVCVQACMESCPHDAGHAGVSKPAPAGEQALVFVPHLKRCAAPQIVLV